MTTKTVSTLPTKKQIRNLFPGYQVSIAEREIEVAVDRLTLRRVNALIVKRIVSKTETRQNWKRDTYTPVEMDTFGAGAETLKDAGFNVFCSAVGLAIIPSDVVRTRF